MQPLNSEEYIATWYNLEDTLLNEKFKGYNTA